MRKSLLVIFVSLFGSVSFASDVSSVPSIYTIQRLLKNERNVIDDCRLRLSAITQDQTGVFVLVKNQIHKNIQIDLSANQLRGFTKAFKFEGAISGFGDRSVSYIQIDNLERQTDAYFQLGANKTLQLYIENDTLIGLAFFESTRNDRLSQMSYDEVTCGEIPSR